ncbi:hypothetical protein DSJ_19965 [Pantoea stewartii subsp. stewartii DC283]|uniref:Uncharacterized protein n=1 Tax=Pantoea stewartii subsp. stewartii DC283 TaxID=660596 RepID=H3R9Q6_PANSE|nr:hypothetical protein [Pantoea stewartii]ARF51368.1 hypothetical protein DSJ_19965 [Pantoea stewartii subsp. stewartii DC283]EHU01919.1 hypothetical protein CKS_0388 [Pantoea stewartii subsp. stewartii DC283]
MRASEFNRRYPPGSHFIYQSCSALRGGMPVKTLDVARDFKCATVVEISAVPYFANINSLTPVEIKAD